MILLVLDCRFSGQGHLFLVYMAHAVSVEYLFNTLKSSCGMLKGNFNLF